MGRKHVCSVVKHYMLRQYSRVQSWRDTFRQTRQGGILYECENRFHNKAIDVMETDTRRCVWHTA